MLYSRDFPGGSVVKNLPANARDMGSVLRLGRSPGGGNHNPLHYSCLRYRMDRRPSWATVHGVSIVNVTEYAHSVCYLFYI